MSYQSYNLRHQPRAHGYQPAVPSRQYRHGSPDVDHEMGGHPSYSFLKSRKRICRSPYDPANLSKRKLLFARGALWFGFIATSSLIAYILVYYLIVRIKGAKSLDITGTQFKGYKNSQFVECIQQTPDTAVNCTLLKANLNATLRLNLDWIGQENHYHFMSGLEY
jgi:hypothetical protein